MLPEDLHQITQAVAQALEPRFSGLESKIDTLAETVARLESRVASLTQSVQGMASRMVTVEVELRELSDRLGRMSAEGTRSRTADTDRYARLEARIAALEARLATANDG